MRFHLEEKAAYPFSGEIPFINLSAGNLVRYNRSKNVLKKLLGRAFMQLKKVKTSFETQQ